MAPGNLDDMSPYEKGARSTVNESTTAVCRKKGVVEPDAMLIDSNHAAFELAIDFERGHHKPSICGLPTTRSR
jgi:hypothetical protein